MNDHDACKLPSFRLPKPINISRLPSKEAIREGVDHVEAMKDCFKEIGGITSPAVDELIEWLRYEVG